MLNKIRTDFEILASKVDPFVNKKDQDFLSKFDFEGLYRGSECQQGISCCRFFLVRVLTVE
jgi:hypothetical protein